MASPYYARRPDDTQPLYRARWSPPKDGQPVPDGHAWGRITWVPADYVPRRRARREPAQRLPRGFWTPLLHDLMLRLERTPSGQLCIPFPNRELARRAYFALSAAFEYRQMDVSMQTGFYEAPPALYVSRGPAWTNPAPSDSERVSLSK